MVVKHYCLNNYCNYCYRPTLNIAAPEYMNAESLCQIANDIWMVGNLFSKVTFSLSSFAQNFRDKLMNQNPCDRPTADDALKDDWLKGVER